MYLFSRQGSSLATRCAPLVKPATGTLSQRHQHNGLPLSFKSHFSTKMKMAAAETALDDIVVPTTQPGVEHKSIVSHPEGVLVRDFVRESLYSESGYFNASRVINSPGVINFAQLIGRADYTRRLQELYYSGVQGWTTPVEIFQPHYAHAIARWMLSHVIPSINLKSVIPEADLANTQKAVDHSASSTGAEYGVGDLISAKDVVHKRASRNNTSQNTSKTTSVTTNAAAHVDTEAQGRVRRFGVPLTSKDMSAGKMRVFEIGAGNGTCAVNILDFLRTYYPQVYGNTQYNIIEMSESLSWQQRELLDASHPQRYQVHTANAAEWKQPQSEHAFVFGLEVLDNMPHDKVVKGKDGVWYQVMVAKAGCVPAEGVVGADVIDAKLLNTGKAAIEAGFVEYAVPINDPVVAQCLELYVGYLESNDNDNITTDIVARPNSSAQKKPGHWLFQRLMNKVWDRVRNRTRKEIVYLPTECLRFFLRLDTYFPSHTLLLVDFDSLPSTEATMGVNGPVVARKSDEATKRGKTSDMDSYMAPLGSCDIFYPTDFAFLKHMYAKVVLKDSPYRDAIHHFGLGATTNDMCLTPKENVATVITHFDFLWKYAETSKTECRNGFNPLLEDYTNMAVFVGARHQSKQ